MNTKRAGALSQRRRQVAEGIKAVSAVQDTVVAGMDEESRKNFLAGRPCKPEKLTEDAKKIIETYGHNVVDKFFLLKSDKDVLRTLNDAEIGKPIIMMYPNRSAHMWQLMYFVVQKTEKENKITILFKDPAGNDIAQNLEKEIKKSFENVEIITNTQKQLNKNQMYAYGPVTLENIKTLINFLNKHRQWLEFTDENFLKLKDMQQDYLKAVIELTTELKENDKFLIALKKFLNDIPVALVPLVNKYTETLQGMSEEDDDDLKCEEISNNRNELFSKGMVTNLKHQFKNMSIDSENEFKLEIQKNFPKEMTKLNEIFEILDNVKIDKEFFEALKIISQALQLDFEKLKSFYESRIRAKEDEAENIIKSDAIDEIAKQLPEPKQSSCTDCSPLHELMAEIVIGKDGEDSEESDKNDLTDKYMAIVEKYESWKNATIYDINDWAKNHKGNLGATEDDIIEAVAVMDRAFHLVTGGFQLRAPQILSVLVFLHNQQNAGRLCQIKTGEGKTVIVSLLAVIKCLQGHRVDVLTTNPLLAAEGVTETKRFYSVFGISVATNNKGSDGSINPSCYTADVLYGTITNFQFDHLKDSLGESNTRRGRHFDVVILDEVDSMLIDNGGHIAKLASPYPGMEYLRYVYINIWAALQRADAEYAKESKQEIKEIILNNPIEEAQIQYDSCLEKRSVNKYKAIKKIISATDPTNIPFLPKHLRDYAASQLDTWLTNALHAKYECHEHIQYRLITDENGGKKVVPIDYQNTGVTMTKTIWSKGLHQFVQIKHNIELTYETLTSSYISNLGYVNMYKDVNIYGMTGTLGSEAEQDLLSKIYKIDFAKIPTFRAKQFRELPGTVVEDDDWAERVAVEILSFVDQGRAALVVCESEEDLMAVEQNLQLLKDDEFRVRFYYREEHADETTEKVKVGDVILATNIAGRGTNFKTDKVVEGNGGLHVIVGFLPCNLRVEGQAFGRTSRQGNNGSAQLVIRRREVNELLPEIREDVSFEEVKALRDSAEFKRLEKIGNEFVKELNFKDTLYGLFADFYRKETQFAASEEYEYVRKDLKELWAFWLEKKHFTAKNITIDPSAVFDEFKQKAKTIIDGEISHNAYYAIGVADYYLGHGNFEEAQKFVERAIEISGDMNIAGAYLKKFEAFFETGSSFLERLNEILKKYLHINFFDIKSIDLSVVQSSLKKARSHIENEVEYVKGLMEDSNLATILLPEEGENHFLKHLRSRACCLNVQLENVKQLCDDVGRNKVIEARTPADLKNLRRIMEGSSYDKILSVAETRDLANVGLNIIYSIKPVREFRKKIIEASLGLIGGGVAALCVGLAFPPSFPFMASVAGTLISEGIIDIVMELLVGSDGGAVDYIKQKVFTIGMSILTFGLSSVLQVAKVARAAIKICRQFMRLAQKTKISKLLGDKTAATIKKIDSSLKNTLEVAQFQKFSKMQKLNKLNKLLKENNLPELNKFGGEKMLQSLRKVSRLSTEGKMNMLRKAFKKVKSGALKKAKKAVKNRIEEILDELENEILDMLIEELFNMLDKHLRSNKDIIEKLTNTSIEDIRTDIEKFIKENIKIREILKDVPRKLAELKRLKGVAFLKSALDLVRNSEGLRRYILTFTKHLGKMLVSHVVQEVQNNVDDVVNEICGTVRDHVVDVWTDVLRTSEAIVKPIVKATKKVIKAKQLAIDALTTGSMEVFKTFSNIEEYYAIFDLEKDASLSEIAFQYRKMRLLFHPAKYPDDENIIHTANIIEAAHKYIIAAHPLRNI